MELFCVTCGTFFENDDQCPSCKEENNIITVKELENWQQTNE